jgi:hypothetical protein
MVCNILKIRSIFFLYNCGTNNAMHIVLFISSLLSPGEAGLAYVSPAFLFLEQAFSPVNLGFFNERPH